MVKCVKRNRLALLRSAIKETRSNSAKIDLELYHVHLQLLNSTHGELWTKVDKVTHAMATREASYKQQSLNNKFRILRSSQRPIAHHDGFMPSSIIDNRSVIPLNKAESELLELGLNYAIPPPKKAIDDLICHLDFGIEKCSSDKVQALKTKAAVSTMLERLPLSNRSSPPPLLRTIKDLTDKPIYILKADKGNKTVVVDKASYDQGITDLLNDVTTYTRLTKDPTNKILSELKTTLATCTSLPPLVSRRLVPSVHLLPKIYAVPKIHKPDMPYRPIISSIGTILQPTANFVSKKIAFTNAHIKRTVSNSTDLVNILRTIHLDKNDILVSFDIQSLFSNIPPDEALEALEGILLSTISNTMDMVECQDLIYLTKTCLKNNFFLYKDTFFHQHKGLAMGSSLSPTLANVFMGKIEDKIFTLSDITPKLWIRYVDDVFAIWQHTLDQLHSFIQLLNSIHPDIQFTVEMEKEGQLPFLDVMISRTNNSNLSTTVYRKPNSVCTMPHAMSNHPWTQKISALRTFVNRAHQICSDTKDLECEIIFLKNLAKSRGFEPSIVDKLVTKFWNTNRISNATTLVSQKRQRNSIVLPFIPRVSSKIAGELKKFDIHTNFKPSLKLHSFFTQFKTKESARNKPGVYHIICSDCNCEYIGQTTRSFKFRCDEHRRATGFIRNKFDSNKVFPDKSAVAAHVAETNHQIDWANSGIIKSCPNHLLDIYEQLFIYKSRHYNLNRKEDNQFPLLWQRFIS